jgi:formamidase
VRFAGLIHPGILGCAPSAEILAEWNRRESELISTTSLERIVAQPPEPQNVHVGKGKGDEELTKKVGKEGARTIPGRPEHGGNCDIKNLSRGSKVYLPVHVKVCFLSCTINKDECELIPQSQGAKFSVGDLHFSQGDGEISFCGAIEIAGIITLKFDVIKNGQELLGMKGGKSPIFLPGPVQPQFGPGRMLCTSSLTSLFPAL